MFKKKFKYFKAKTPLPDLSHVLDLHKYETFKDKVQRIDVHSKHFSMFGLIPYIHWEAYQIINNPGLIYIKNPFTIIGQKYWIVRCLQEYTKRTNKSNLDIHNVLSDDENWWTLCQKTNDLELTKKLRWVTMGYHHNWDTKVYSECSKNDMPLDLTFLCEQIANVLGFENFKAEAAIVNYYHLDSTLSGHTDHSEENLDAPLFSLSFGQSAIFLIGGTSLETEPTAIFLHSGDIIVMSKQSRICYHGVPKIVLNEHLAWNNDTREESDVSNKLHIFDETVINNSKSDIFWKPFEHYLQNSRININVRQVLCNEQSKLSI